MLNRKTCSNDVIIKKYSSECFLEMNESENNIGGHKKNKVFTEILQEIRDMKVLSNYQLYHLRQTSRISRSELLEIIELYNFVIRNVNVVLMVEDNDDEIRDNISASNRT